MTDNYAEALDLIGAIIEEVEPTKHDQSEFDWIILKAKDGRRIRLRVSGEIDPNILGEFE